MKDLYLHIDSHVDESIEQLFELVRQPSISAQKLGFDKAPGLMKDLLERNGFEAERGKPTRSKANPLPQTAR